MDKIMPNLKNLFFSLKFLIKKMFSQDEGKIECAVGNMEICFWQAREPRFDFDFISDVGIRGIYLPFSPFFFIRNRKQNDIFSPPSSLQAISVYPLFSFFFIRNRKENTYSSL